jgi:branched-chain amino acid transport system ATP-binding protein
MSLLQVRGFKVAYGGIQAVRGIDFEVAEGELVCLIGANGAGKSSTLKGVMGLAHPKGEVLFNGERLHKLPTHAIAARGLALVPEGRGIFGRLTVSENLDMGAFTRRDKAGIKADLARVYGLFPRLEERREQLAGTLSGGEQQMLAIARALMGRPRLLLLDEPSMGLAPLMVRKDLRDCRGHRPGGRHHSVGGTERQSGSASEPARLRHGKWCHHSGRTLGPIKRRSQGSVRLSGRSVRTIVVRLSNCCCVYATGDSQHFVEPLEQSNLLIFPPILHGQYQIPLHFFCFQPSRSISMKKTVRPDPGSGCPIRLRPPAPPPSPPPPSCWTPPKLLTLPRIPRPPSPP